MRVSNEAIRTPLIRGAVVVIAVFFYYSTHFCLIESSAPHQAPASEPDATAKTVVRQPP